MKKILCFVDLENTSNDAVEYAAEFAKSSGAELVLMHILSLPVPQEIASENLGYLYTAEKLEKKAQEKLHHTRTLVEDQFKISCQSVVKTDFLNLNKEIQYEANAHVYDLVVMGTNGAENVRQYLFGSNSEKLITRTTVPLLIVPQGSNFKIPKHIVYTSDYETSDAYVVKLVQTIAGSFNPRITVLHVSKKASVISDTLYRSLTSELDDELNDSRVSYERIFSEDVAEGIDDFMKQGDNNMLVMLSKNHSFFDQLFGAHVIQKINTAATYPVLIIHAPKLAEQRDINPKNVIF